MDEIFSLAKVRANFSGRRLGLFRQGFKRIVQMANVGTSTDYDPSNDTDHLTMLVDSGASGHYCDDQLLPGLTDQLLNYKELERPHKIVIARRHVLRGTAPRHSLRIDC